MLQNWSFLATVVDHLNRLPSKQHGTNVMRIRPLYVVPTFNFFSLICFVCPAAHLCQKFIKKILMFRYLDGHARFYRQSIILSSYLTPGVDLPTCFHLWLNSIWSSFFLYFRYPYLWWSFQTHTNLDNISFQRWILYSIATAWTIKERWAFIMQLAYYPSILNAFRESFLLLVLRGDKMIDLLCEPLPRL